MIRKLMVWCGFAAGASLIGVLAAWPIYQTPWLLVPAGAGLFAAAVLVGLGARLRWSAPVHVVAAALLFALTVLPVAVPHAWRSGPAGVLPWLGDALAAVLLGWKQLLTLTLPVGTYQTVLVPAYVVFFGTALLSGWIAQRASQFAAWAALPLLFPVAFGTVFGASQVSAPAQLGPFTISAPRELALWAAAVVVAAAWVAWRGGAARRAALRRGGRSAPAQAWRGAAAAGMLVLALLLGAGVAPLLAAPDRVMPRDRVDPQLVVAAQPSPLAEYRAWKTDARIDAPLFTVRAGDATPPERLRLAVLDAYSGVEFHVAATDRFTRFPTAPPAPDAVPVTIEIAEGYRGIWAPVAELASAPEFLGPRAEQLSDAWYVNQRTGAAIAVPGERGAEGLLSGDGYRALMRPSSAAELAGAPLAEEPLIALENLPELAAWVRAQDQPASWQGLRELVDRLRARGYLSHALTGADSEWVSRLATRTGGRFEPSVGGHSVARIEELFAQLNTQQRAAGDSAPAAQLVAAAGDDEQFATAAALVARALGFDSRVVVGVRLIAEVPGVPACVDTCTGEHLAAWVEVRGANDIWVPIDVTPQSTLPPSVLTEGEQLPEFPTTPEERDAREVDPPLGFGDRNDPANEPEPAQPATWLWPVLRGAGLLLAALALLALPVLCIPVAKRVRARLRRREPVPELRAIAAWQELVDRAADAGLRLPATRSDAAAVMGTAAAQHIAAEVDRAVFAPASFTAAEADRLWELVETDTAQRRAQLTRWMRLRQAYALRSLGIQFGRRRGDARESAAHPPLSETRS